MNGESKVPTTLAELDDSYHILCDVKIDLGRLITYPISKKTDLKKSQIDFVVVSKI